MGRSLLYHICELKKKRLTQMNFGFDQADQYSRLGQKSTNSILPVYVCLVASKYGKMYHVKMLWVT